MARGEIKCSANQNWRGPKACAFVNFSLILFGRFLGKNADNSELELPMSLSKSEK